MELLKQHGVQWADLQFTDLLGRPQRITTPAKKFDRNAFALGSGKFGATA